MKRLLVLFVALIGFTAIGCSVQCKHEGCCVDNKCPYLKGFADGVKHCGHCHNGCAKKHCCGCDEKTCKCCDACCCKDGKAKCDCVKCECCDKCPGK